MGRYGKAGKMTRILAAGMSALLLAVLVIFYWRCERTRTLHAALGRLEPGCEALSFSEESGFFEEGFVLTLTPDPELPEGGGIGIHYTLNGDEPTADSPLYQDGIDLAEAYREALRETARLEEERQKAIAEAEAQRLEEERLAAAVAAEAETPSLEDGRRTWQKEIWTAASDDGVRTVRDGGGICVIPVRVCLVQGDDKSPVQTRTYVIGPGVTGRYRDVYVASVVTDSRNLFDYEQGIMVKGSHYQKDVDNGVRPDRAGNFYQTGEEWIKDGHVTLFSSDGKALLEEDVGLTISGYSSRNLPTRSFRAEASGAHGTSGEYFTLDIFSSGLSGSGKPYTAADAPESGETGLLSDPSEAAGTSALANPSEAAGTSALANPSEAAGTSALADPSEAAGETAVREVGQFKKIKFRTHGVPTYHIRCVRNQYAKRLTDECGFYGLTENRQGVMFLNGEFYTACDITPSADTEYLCSLFGLNVPDAMEKYSGSDVDVYTKAKILRLFTADLTDPAIQENLERAVDMDNYLQYFALEVLFNNADWPYNNVTIWRYLGEEDPENPYTDGRIRFVLDDMDQILSNNLHGDPTRWSTELVDYLMKDKGATFHHVMECDRYRDTFLTYVDDLLRTAFEPEHACAVLDELYTGWKREYLLDYGEAFWEEMEHTAEVTKQNVREKEALYRADIETYMGLTDRYNVRIEAGEGVTVTWNNDCGTSPDKKIQKLGPGGTWSGEYYCGTSFSAEAVATEGYRFAGWEVNGVLTENGTSDTEAGNLRKKTDSEGPGAIRISDALLQEGRDASAGGSAGETVTVRAVAVPAQ